MEIRSRFSVKIPSFLVKVLGINEKSKIASTFKDGVIVLDITSHNRRLVKVGETATLNMEQEEWIQSGFIAGIRKGREEGYSEGYEAGYDEGHDAGFESGCEIGELEGYFEGYGNGYSDGDEGKPYNDIRPDSVEEECDCDCNCDCASCPLHNK